MTDETKMDEMNTISLDVKNTVYHCKALLEDNGKGMPLSSVKQEILKIKFDGIYKLILLSERCWLESKK